MSVPAGSSRSPVDDALDRLTETRRNVAASLIAVKGHLDAPYPDDPRWTPWTRFIERELQRLDESRGDLATVREALERQRDDNGRLVQVMDGMARESDLEHQSERRAYWRKRAEAAEAEVRRLNVDLENEAVAYERAREDVRRLTEGLREAETGFNDISLILEAENDGYQERAYKRAMEEWRHVRALLAANPPQGDAEGSSPTDGGGA